MMANAFGAKSLASHFKSSMRVAAASVSLVASRDANGAFHGMAVTSATSLSMDPPSMLVAINKSASIHPVILQTRRFSLNLMANRHGPLLEAFSSSELREKRFVPENWRESDEGLPILRGALAVHLCTVEEAHPFGSHTVFFGRVDDILLSDTELERPAPIVWLNGTRISVSTNWKA
jgi:flavin reductase (DIM6/NTAB) family NADH-FMN oxidoreductase RutF